MWLVPFLIFGGCATSRQALFTATGEGWRVQQGQAIWQPQKNLPELAGELVLARHPDGRCLVEFSKPPVAMAVAQITPHRWLVRFPPQAIGFGGRGRPSQRFAWLHLPSALEGKKLPRSFRFTRGPDGNWRLENSRTGEVVKGFLEP